MMMEIELEKIVNRNEMIEELLKRNCKVIFQEVDGTERTMICTLQESAIGTDKAQRDVKSRNENVIAVWDVENKGWRSFKTDSVISFS